MTKEQAYQQVAANVRALEAALWQMKEIHDPRTIGIAEWVEDLEDCLSDLESDVFDEDYE